MEANGAAGWDASAAAWTARVDEGDPSREMLLDPVVLELCGDVAGLTVLDVGCGEGRFGRMLAARGAAVTGFDPCRALVTTAVARHPTGCYLVASAEAMPYADSHFDLAVCYLVLLDVPDFRRAILEMARVLRPGGRLVVANMLSFRTCADDSGWVWDAAGNRLHVAVDNYFTEKAVHVAWCGISVTNYHRPAEAYFSAFIGAGLRLAAYREPAPTDAPLAAHAAFEANARVPLFNVAVWAKDARAGSS
ncbi:MAG: class I SAM-dependent methyltransferase [Fimbriimonadaceae bacterium]